MGKTKPTIKKYSDLTREIALLEERKDLAAAKIANDVTGIKQQLLSIKNGFLIAQSIVKLFKAGHENQIPPKEKVKNIAINTALDIITEILDQRMTAKQDVQHEQHPPNSNES